MVDLTVVSRNGSHVQFVDSSSDLSYAFRETWTTLLAVNILFIMTSDESAPFARTPLRACPVKNLSKRREADARKVAGGERK